MSDRRAAVLRLLARHRCLDAAERQAVDETIALLRAGGDPFSRSNLPGHITASAIVRDDPGEHVLIVWHEGLRRWLQPGGHCEPGDASPMDTAARETMEETGVRPRVPRPGGWLVHVDVHDIPARGPEPSHRHHDLRFAFVSSYASAPPLPVGGSCGWARADALERLGVDESLRLAVVRALRDAIAPAGQHSDGSPN